MTPTLTVPRPRTLVLLAISLVCFFALLHPSSPTHYSAITSSISRPLYSGYPPNMPDFAAAGFNRTGAEGHADRRHANATFVVLARNSDLWVRQVPFYLDPLASQSDT